MKNIDIDPRGLVQYCISVRNLNLAKYRSSITSVSVVQSFWNFAYGTAVILSCAVQNFKATVALSTKLWTNEISRELSLNAFLADILYCTMPLCVGYVGKSVAVMIIRDQRTWVQCESVHHAKYMQIMWVELGLGADNGDLSINPWYYISVTGITVDTVVLSNKPPCYKCTHEHIHRVRRSM